MKNNICCIFNLAPHYRYPIYQLMDSELHCDFYFGDKVDSPIKLMDYKSLKGFKKILPNIKIPNTGFEWQKGVWQLAFKPYKHYIITGTPGSISNWVLALLAIPLRKKVYAWTHGMKGNTTPIGKIIEKYFYRLCHKILLYGDYSKEIMLKEGFKENSLIPIYNSLDYETQLKVRKQLCSSKVYTSHFNNNHPVLTYIGRIQKIKKLDLLISALEKLIERGLPCNLSIIGDDVDKEEIHILVTEKGLGKNVWFYGPCYDEKEIGNLIYNSDVCVTPGLIGLTAIHSLTYGTPAITSNDFSKHGPEFEAIKPDITGDYFEKDNLEDLTQVISRWISLKPSKREEVRADAYKIIDTKYNPNQQIEILKKLLNQ